MLIEEVDPDPRRGLAPLIEELERHGGALTVVDDQSGTTGSRAVLLHLPDDEYREKRCREVLKDWHGARS